MPDKDDKSKDEPRVEKPVVVSNPMYETEQVAPDGHVNLSKEDIESRG